MRRAWYGALKRTLLMPALAASPAMAVVAGWEALALAPVTEFLIASPSDIAVWTAANGPLLLRAALNTLWAAVQGFVWGNLAGAALAVLCTLAPRAAPLVGALALFAFCLPMVATGPILRVLYGPGIGPQVTIAAMAVFYTTFLALLVGLRAAPAAWFDLIASYGRGRFTQLARIRTRAAIPYAIAGLQIAAPAAVLGAMVGEFTGAERGLGVLAIRAMRALDVPATWSLAATSAALSIAAYLALGALGRRLSPGPAPVLLAPPAAARRIHPAMPLAAALAILALWQGLMDGFALSPFFAKRPAEVWQFLSATPDALPTLRHALGQTLVLALPGYIAGIALGVALAAAVTLRPSLAAAALPLAIALRSVPIVTTAPLVVLALGRGATGTIAIVAVMTFFPTFVAALAGIRQVPQQVQDVFASYAATPRQRLLHAQLPAMVPAAFAAARMAVPAAILAATTTEWLATGIGMGTLMAISASTSAYGMLWSCVIVLALVASLGYAGVAALEARVLARLAPEQLRP
jgi:ABC-type nitrate/sulfonate/bicarbonate transport system permease component